MRSIIFILLIFLASCAVPITFADKNSITINHHINGHHMAVEDAQKHCQKFGKKVKPDKSSCTVRRCISYFNCVKE